MIVLEYLEFLPFAPSSSVALQLGSGSCLSMLKICSLCQLPSGHLQTKNAYERVHHGTKVASPSHYLLLTHWLRATQEGSALGYTSALLGYWPGHW